MTVWGGWVFSKLETKFEVSARIYNIKGERGKSMSSGPGLGNFSKFSQEECLLGRTIDAEICHLDTSTLSMVVTKI